MIILKKKHKNSIINIIKGTSIENDNDCQLIELNKTINNNGNYTYTPIGDIIGYNKVNINVDVPQETFETETKDITITENGTTTVVPSDGYDGMTEVNINVDVPSGGSGEYDLITELGYTIDENTIANNSLDNNINKSILLSKEVPNDFNNYWLTNTVPTLRFFPKIDTSNINNFRGLFKNMSCLVYIPRLTINSNCTDLEMTFAYCYNLDNIDTTNWDVSNIINMKDLFYNCRSLSSLDLTNLDMSNVTLLNRMFWDCRNLIEIKGLNKNLPNLTNISSVFYNCTSLLSLDLSNWNTSNISTLESIFYNCRSLTSLNLSSWNTSNVTNISSLFSYCTNLIDLNLSGWNLINCSSINSFIFYQCYNLTNLQAPQNINAEISFSDCNNLTVDSLLSILNNLTNRNGTLSMKCHLGATNLAKLTAEQKAIATNKNWILS